MKEIYAERNTGGRVRKGDRVLAVWENGRKSYGDVTDITGTRRFTEFRRRVASQTYTLRLSDGTSATAHAWHIRFAMPRRNRRR